MPETLRIENGVAWVGDRRLPEGTQTNSFDHSGRGPNGENLEFHMRGFSLPFENGWTVGVMWGRGPGIDSRREFVEESEVATATVTHRDGRVVVWDEEGRPIGKSMDHVGIRGDLPAAQILVLIDEVESWPSDHLPIIDRN